VACPVVVLGIGGPQPGDGFSRPQTSSPRAWSLVQHLDHQLVCPRPIHRVGTGRIQPSRWAIEGCLAFITANAGIPATCIYDAEPSIHLDFVMYGPDILVRTLSEPTRQDRYGNRWQYHSRSDHHSKVACWGIVFDLLRVSPLLKRHVGAGVVYFGINHEMRDFVHDRKKNLDLVLCTASGAVGKPTTETLADMAAGYEIHLRPKEAEELASLPILRGAPVGSVLMALEAKACMTAHQRALPRLYDELNSSHLTVHGATDQAIAAGFTMVNISERYLSPDLNKKNRATDPEWSKHNQPRDAGLAVEKIRQLPKRSKTGDTGYDALAIVVVDCPNDGSPVNLTSEPPAPQPGDIYHYASMIDRLAHIYATRFKDL
jgi:hypothetical protein